MNFLYPRAQTKLQSAEGPVDITALAGTMNGQRFLSGQATLDAPTYNAQARLDIVGGKATLSGSYASALWIGEGVRTKVKAQSLGVAVVKIPGVEGVPVFLENRPVGKTDRNGVLVIGPIRHLETNHIRIDENALPIGYELTTTEQVAVPNRNHVALVEYVPRSTSALVVRLTHQGQDVPLGSSLKGTEIIVGYGGEVYFDQPEAGKTYQIDGLCQFALPAVLPKLTDATPVIACE